MTVSTISAFAAVAALILGAGACTRGDSFANAAAITAGDPHRGRDAISAYGCASCHEIAGIRGARGLVGPPLTGIASRSYVGGVLTNSPENMIRWIMDPPAVNPLTAMPNLDVNERDARDITAYLYTLTR